MNKKHLVEIVLFVFVGVVLLGGGLGMILKNKSGIEAQKMAVSQTSTAEINTNSETADWKTYRNEQYGFEIKYPPTHLASFRLKNSSKAVPFVDQDLILGSFSVEDSGSHTSVSVEIRPLDSLSVWDFDSNETYYDQEKNQWILKKSVGDVPPVCTKLLNENKTMPAIVRGMGDAGCSSASWYLITNKNYAIALRVSQCGYDLDLNALAEQIKGTFVVLPEVQIIAPTCK